MDRKTERAYKRTCFQGRGLVARWLDRAFFSVLGGACLLILSQSLAVSCCLSLCLLMLLVLWDRRRWTRYKRQLWQRAAKTLKREDWLRQAAEDIRQGGGVILHPVPDLDSLMGFCLRHGPGTAFHCFGDVQEKLAVQASTLSCSITFHPWGEGAEPSREQVLNRLTRDAPKPNTMPWRSLATLPGNRYLLTGGLLLLLSILLRRAIYWRLLGSLCLLIGAIRRSLRVASNK